MPRIREVMLGLGLATGSVGVASDSHVDKEMYATGPDSQGENASDYILGQSTEYGKIDHHFFDRDLVLNDIEKRIIGDTGLLTPEERMEREKYAKEIREQWCNIVGKFAKQFSVKHFSDSKKVLLKDFASITADEANKDAILSVVQKYATITNIPVGILLELIGVESRFDSFATSTAKPSAKGITQLRPLSAREAGLKVDDNIDERLDLELSVYAGASQLRHYIDKCHGAKDLGLMVYNMGEGNFKDMICRTYSEIEHKLVKHKNKAGKIYHKFTFTEKGNEQFTNMVNAGRINVVDIFGKNRDNARYDLSYAFKMAAMSDLVRVVVNNEITDK